MRTTRGFTLIELLVVIAIIGLLSAIVLASLTSARNKGSDAARIADVKALKTAMELYYNDNNAYPQGCSGVGSDTGTYLTSLSSCLVPKYISAIPALLISDNDQYAWSAASGYGYGLYVYQKGSGSGSYCLTGSAYNPGWWGATPCNF